MCRWFFGPLSTAVRFPPRFDSLDRIIVVFAVERGFSSHDNGLGFSPVSHRKVRLSSFSIRFGSVPALLHYWFCSRECDPKRQGFSRGLALFLN